MPLGTGSNGANSPLAQAWKGWMVCWTERREQYIETVSIANSDFDVLAAKETRALSRRVTRKPVESASIHRQPGGIPQTTFNTS